MKDIKLKINGNIVIYFGEITYKCILQDIRDEYLLINIPVGQGSYLAFENDQEVEMNYYLGNYYYSFNTKVLGRQKEGTLTLYKLGIPYDIKRVQRRNYVRVDLIENLFIQRKNDEEGKPIKALVLNLSGGGMRISVADFLNEEEEILINFVLEDEEETTQINGKVVREIERRGNNQIYGVQFVDIKESIRDKIIKKVFCQMRKQRDVV